MSHDDRRSHLRRVLEGPDRWHRVFLLAATVLGGACGPPRAAVPLDGSAYQVGAVVRFTTDVDHHELYALRAPRRYAWSEALVVRGRSGHYRDATARPARLAATEPSAPAGPLAPSAGDRPLVIVVHVEGGARPGATAVVVPVDTGRASDFAAVEDTGAAVGPARACIGDTWTAAFFLDGVGAPPAGPVMVRIPTADSAVRLRVDPERHRVRAEPALHLRVGDPGVDASLAAARNVTLRVPGTFAVLPLVLRRGGRRWEAAVSLDRGTYVSAYFADPGLHEERMPPTEEWRVFLLERPASCGARE